MNTFRIVTILFEVWSLWTILLFATLKSTRISSLLLRKIYNVPCRIRYNFSKYSFGDWIHCSEFTLSNHVWYLSCSGLNKLRTTWLFINVATEVRLSHNLPKSRRYTFPAIFPILKTMLYKSFHYLGLHLAKPSNCTVCSLYFCKLYSFSPSLKSCSTAVA